MTDFAFDIAIIGAGASGIAAAVAASRQGKRVVLLEKNEMPGGRATASAVGTICGVLTRSENGKPVEVHGGFPKDFVDRIKEKSGTDYQKHQNGLYFVSYDLDAFRTVCEEVITENQISFFNLTEVCEVSRSNTEITNLTCSQKGSTIKINTKAVIDCSGLAVISMLSDLSVISSAEYQSAAMVFGMSQVETSDPFTIDLAIKRAVMQSALSPEDKAYFEGLSVVPGSLNTKKVLLKMGIPIKITDPRAQEEIISAAAQKMVDKAVSFLKEHVGLFAHAELNYKAPEVGFRVGQRPRGKQILTEKDVLTCQKLPHAIARGTWPIEIWKNGNRVEMKYFSQEDFYDIGLDHLRTQEISNLFFAGRMISADDDAIASARVIGTCLATGFAAGAAAAGFLENKSDDEIVQFIQDIQLNHIPASA